MIIITEEKNKKTYIVTRVGKLVVMIVIFVLGLVAGVYGAEFINKDDVKKEKQQQQAAPPVQTTQMPSISPTRTPEGVVPPTVPTFEIRGSITSVSGNSFVLEGRTILINPAKVGNFQQRTSVKVGNQVKVEGIVENGIFYAREIDSLVDNSGRN